MYRFGSNFYSKFTGWSENRPLTKMENSAMGESNWWGYTHLHLNVNQKSIQTHTLTTSCLAQFELEVTLFLIIHRNWKIWNKVQVCVWVEVFHLSIKQLFYFLNFKKFTFLQEIHQFSHKIKHGLIILAKKLIKEEHIWGFQLWAPQVTVVLKASLV